MLRNRSVRSLWAVVVATAAALVLPAAAAAAIPTLHAALNDPDFTGNVGSATPGVTVAVKLERNTLDADGDVVQRVVDQASDTTDADGDWSLTLSDHAPTDSRDTMVVEYDGPGAPVDAEYSAFTPGLFHPTYTLANQNPDFGADKIAGFCNCLEVTVKVNGAAIGTAVPAASGDNPGYWELDPDANPGINDLVEIVEEHLVNEGEPAEARVFMTSLAPLPGQQGLMGPSCQADLVSKVVRCIELVEGGPGFVVQRNDGAEVPLTVDEFGPGVLEPNQGHGPFGHATLDDIQAGDEIKLKVAGGGRTISTLHVATLRVDIAADGAVTGVCQPGRWLRFWEDFDDPEPLCPASGVMAGDDTGMAVTDDLSAGKTVVRVPQLTSSFPAAGSMLSTLAFTGRASLGFYADEVDGFLASPGQAAMSIYSQGADPASATSFGDAAAADGTSASVPANGAYTAGYAIADPAGNTRVERVDFRVRSESSGTDGGGSGATTTPPASQPAGGSPAADSPAGGSPAAGAPVPGAPAAGAPAAGPVASIASVRLGRRTFRAARRGGSIVASAAARRRAPTGTVVRYSLSSPSDVRYTVQRPARGRRVGRRCVPQRRSNRRARRCTRYQTVKGAFVHSGSAGVNSFRFSGRIGRRALRPGSYRLVATPVRGVERGRQRVARFRITR